MDPNSASICAVRLLTILLLGGLAPAFGEPAAAPSVPQRVTQSPALPVWFEPNLGQFAPGVRFASASQQYRLSVTSQGFGVAVTAPVADGAGHVQRSLWLRFAGARRSVAIDGQQRLPGLSHYYLGNDRSQWRENVPQFGRVRYDQVWDGIDAVIYGSAAQLEYDFIVAPGRNPGTIALDLDGATRVAVDLNGALVVDVDGAQVVQRAPVAYQEIAGARRAVDVAYRIEGTRVGFTVGRYDRSLPLVIDPIVIVYASFLGGSGTEFVESTSQAAGIEVDTAGNLIVALDTNSVDLPSATNAAPPASNILIMKVNPTASAVIFSTYLGGNGDDTRGNLHLDPAGAIYVSGRTGSTNLPVTAGAIRTTKSPADPADGLLARLTPAGVLDYLTYIGGSGTDSAEAIEVANGKVYVAGSTSSGDLGVTATAARAIFGGGFDAWIARFDLSAASPLEYLSYLGGNAQDAAFSIAVDDVGRFTVAGLTRSGNFPITATAFQSVLKGESDAFVTRFAANGAIDYSTYLGGSSTTTDTLENAKVAIGPDGSFVLIGFTDSADFPAGTAPTPFQPAKANAFDAFVAKLDPALPPSQQLTARTFVGGGGDDFGIAAALDATGNVYLTGFTFSTTFPVAQPVDNAAGGNSDAFVLKLDPSLSTLLFSTYLGGASDDRGYAIAVDATSSIYVLGRTLSAAPFTPVAAGGGAPVGPARKGAVDAFIVKYADSQAPALAAITPTIGPTAGGTPFAITGTSFLVGSTVTFDGLPATAVQATSTVIRGLTPAHAVGTVNVVVTSPTGAQTTLTNGFRYAVDTDGDGIPDEWEIGNGLNPNDPNDADADDDDDGASNEQEYLDGTDPKVAQTRYFAEGATIGIFSTQFAVANPDRFRTATTVFEFQTKDGTVIKTTRTVAPLARVTVVPGTEVAGLADAEFSTVIRSNLLVAADRTMTWDDGVYGSHAEAGVASPSDTWYLAEGATIGSFNLFYLIQNPNTVDVTVGVKYLLKDGAPVEKDYLIRAKSRDNIWVNLETIGGVSLSNRELSAVLTTHPSTPIIVERAMYQDAPGKPFNAGHESAGVTDPSTNWFLAEGATGSFLDMFILVANPNPTPANLTVQYLLASGPPITLPYRADPNSRFNIWVDLEPGLADVAVSTVINSDVPVIVERALWWSGDPSNWYEAHNSPGATSTGTTWVLGEGEVGGAHATETYVLVANTSAFAGTARVTLLFDDGSPSTSIDVALPANSRVNVPVGEATGSGGFGAVAHGKRFGVLIESLGATPAAIVVERAMYSSQPGQFWAAGTNALATRIR